MSETIVGNNKRIAKNTLMLYIRMLLSMVVSLYTSRVVLNTLGVEDYGIYGVVGGVVSMFSFLNASMSGATSRFLTFEMGKGNFQRLEETFSSALIIHIGIAFVILILAETVGLWFLTNKLVIPENRMYAAQWVYQLSILSMAVGVTQVPYNASIIAHEKMDIYAYVEILNVTLKLLIVYLLVIGHFDKLLLYAVLTLAISIVIAFIYRVYCIRHFKECYFHWVWKPEMLKPMLSFSGWDLYGNMSVSVRQQGTNMLLNIFFGPTLNAASGIATTVYGIILGLANNVLMAIRPQIIKAYAQKDIVLLQNYIMLGAKYSCALFLCIAIPLYLEATFILQIWLVNVPDYTISFFRVMLIGACLGIMNNTINIGIHATGKVMMTSLITGSLFLLTIPLSYLILSNNGMAVSPYIVHCCMLLFILISNSINLHYYISDFSIKLYFKNVVINVFSLLAFSIILPIFLYNILTESILRFVLIFISSISSITIYLYLFTMDNCAKKKIRNKIFNLL